MDGDQRERGRLTKLDRFHEFIKQFKAKNINKKKIQERENDVICCH